MKTGNRPSQTTLFPVRMVRYTDSSLRQGFGGQAPCCARRSLGEGWECFAKRSEQNVSKGAIGTHHERAPQKTITLLLCLTLLPASLNAFWPFTESKPLTPREQQLQRVQELQEKQIDNPLDPEINYNLGVALYKTGNIDEAATNFARALEHVGANKPLEQRCLFNLANLSVQQALGMLPDKWEQEAVKVDQKVLDAAIDLSQNAITKYDKILKEDKENKRAETNIKKAKAIYEALKKKREKQNQENKQDKKDQNKQDQQQQDKQKQEQQQNQDQQQQQSQRDNQEKEGQKDGQQNKGQSDGKRDSDTPQDKKTGRDDKKLDQGTNKDKQQDNFDHQQTPQKQEPSKPEPTKTDAEKQESAQEAASGAAGQQKDAQETMEERSMRAILENLQSDEAKTQKNMLLRKQAKEQQQHPPVPGQKPW